MVIERIKDVIGQVLDIDFKEHGDQIDIFNCEEWDGINWDSEPHSYSDC